MSADVTGPPNAPTAAAPASGIPSTLLTPEQAAEMLAMPASWVKREARLDRIPHVKLGQSARFDPGVLREWWQSRMQGPVVRRTSSRSVPNERDGR